MIMCAMRGRACGIGQPAAMSVTRLWMHLTVPISSHLQHAMFIASHCNCNNCPQRYKRCTTD
jgi:hypothetical protein